MAAGGGIDGACACANTGAAIASVNPNITARIMTSLLFIARLMR